MNNVVLSSVQLNKTFTDGKIKVEVLKNVSFAAQAAETIAISGRSGSGKSTLLHILGGLERPSEGSVWLRDKNINALSEVERCQLRNKFLGFVYQFHHLLPEFSALENVAMPLLLAAVPAAMARQQAVIMLKRVGLEKRLLHQVGELSGGERQRVAIARAVINQPLCLMADEPTGNLDNYNAALVMDLMQQLNQEFSTTLIVVTHDIVLAKKMHRVLTMEEGCLIE